MSSRFSRHDTARDDLFSSYNRSASPSKSKNKHRASPYNPSISNNNSTGGYGYPSSPGFGAYPNSSNTTTTNPNGSGNLYPSGGSYGGGGYGLNGGGGESGGSVYRSATPNSRGQYSAAVLDELESQNDEQVGVLTSKVKMLKDLTHLIGDEIRDSTALAEKMNDQFESSRFKLKGTMNRMLRMAEKTGVGWKAWVGFFAAVVLVFWWVWLG